MAIDRLPVAVNLDPEAPDGGYLGKVYTPGSLNMMYSTYTDGRPYAETRPALAAYETPPDTGEEVGGARGLFYWETVGRLFIVHRDTIYEGNYEADHTTISDGKDPVYWAEYSTNILIMTDPENNQVWEFTNNGGIVTVRDMTADVNADCILEGIVGGVVVVDGFLVLLSKRGKLYNSTTGDHTIWNALDYQTASRAVDPGIYLAKQREQIVVISSSSIEFYSNAALPEGSPFKRRDDVVYLTGATDYKHVHTNGENIFFIGSSRLGSYSVYSLIDLKLQKIGHQTIDNWINNTLLTYDYDFFMQSGSLGEHYFVYITSCDPNAAHEYRPISTALYDNNTKLWGMWQTEITEIPGYEDSFPVFGITERLGSNVVGQTVLMSDGTLAVFQGESNAVDVIQALPYITEFGGANDAQEYWDPNGYVTHFGEERGYPINPAIVTEEWDGKTYTNKFISRFAVVGRVRPPINDAQGILVMRYSDDTYRTWSHERYCKATTRWMYTRLGKTKRRAFVVQYRGEDPVRFENFELSAEASEWA